MPTFALDAHYIESAGEDAQNFRAVAERSSIPDYTKDGGIAAIDPALTPEWMTARRFRRGLATMSDDQRRTRLARAHVQWLVLSAILHDPVRLPLSEPGDEGLSNLRTLSRAPCKRFRSRSRFHTVRYGGLLQTTVLSTHSRGHGSRSSIRHPLVSGTEKLQDQPAEEHSFTPQDPESCRFPELHIYVVGRARLTPGNPENKIAGF